MKERTFTIALVAVASAQFALLGSQKPQDKIGTVDLERVVFESEEGKENAKNLEEELKARQGLLDFIKANRVITLQQAQRLRALATKANVTAEEKSESDRIKANVIAAAQEFDALNQKQSPSDEDRSKLATYNAQRQNSTALLESWSAEFQQELQQSRDQMIASSGKKASTILQEIAKAEGYTVVFSSPRSAVYGANDLTEKVIKAVDSRR